MQFIKNIFGAIDTRYLIRSYILGIFLFLFVFWSMMMPETSSTQPNKAPAMIFGVISTLLFPFAKLVWDEIRDLIVGNNSIIYFGGWMILLNFFFKMLVNLLLWGFAFFVAPLGILYLWFRSKKVEGTQY